MLQGLAMSWASAAITIAVFCGATAILHRVRELSSKNTKRSLKTLPVFEFVRYAVVPSISSS